MHFGDEGIVNSVQLAGQFVCAAPGPKFFDQGFGERRKAGNVGK
jgi:hypothetical protein